MQSSKCKRPNSVTNLGADAFFYDYHMTNVIIGNGITRIQRFTFNYCYSLTSFTIPNSVTSIETSAFWRCSGLTNLVIGSGVKTIESTAFDDCSGLTSITFPSSITNLGSAFDGCDNLQQVYFQGNAPIVDPNAFGSSGYPITAYYLPGTTGWSTTIGFDVPTVLWNPQAQTGDTSFGVRTNQFGFNITGSSNLVIVVEACTNLLIPSGRPLNQYAKHFRRHQRHFLFSDAEWTNHPNRFYRFRSP